MKSSEQLQSMVTALQLTARGPAAMLPDRFEFEYDHILANVKSCSELGDHLDILKRLTELLVFNGYAVTQFQSNENFCTKFIAVKKQFTADR